MRRGDLSPFASLLRSAGPRPITCESAGFPRNLARLNNVDKACLDDVASRLRQDPRSRVIIIGHADSEERRPAVVARQRAEAAKTYLVVERGLEGVARLGRTPKRATSRSRLPRAANRRVELIFVPDGAIASGVALEGLSGVGRPARPRFSSHPRKDVQCLRADSVAPDRLVGPAPAGVTARAQHWIPVGPPGGDVRSLAVDPLDPQRLYLGTAEGVLYRSDVGGLVWQRLQPGFPRRGQSLDEIVVSPAGAVLVGFWDVHGQGGGVAVSTDRGRTFTIAAGLEGESVRALALAPSDPRRGRGRHAQRRLRLAGRRSVVAPHQPAGPPRAPQHRIAGDRPARSARDLRRHLALPWKTTDGGLTWTAAASRHDRRLGRLHAHARPSRPPARLCDRLHGHPSLGRTAP